MPMRFLSFAAGAGLVALLAQPLAAQLPDPAARTPGESPQQNRCYCPRGQYSSTRGLCVVTVCTVPGMPDGDKGGGYFASQGALYADVPGTECPRRFTVTAVPEVEYGCDRFGSSQARVRLDIQGGTGPFRCEGPSFDFPVTVPAGPCGGVVKPGSHTFKVTDSTGQTQSVTVKVPDVIELLSLDVKAPTCCSCRNGSATVQVRGENGPFTFRWNDPGNQKAPGATGLAAGTYKVTVTDRKGCYRVFDVKVPAAPGCEATGDPGNPASPSGQIWRLGTLRTGKVYPTTVTARNVDCRGRHNFAVSVEGAPWLRITGPSTLSGIAPGGSRATEAEVDFRDAAPGEYRGKIVVRCLTCPPPPKCRQDLTEIDVLVTVE